MSKVNFLGKSMKRNTAPMILIFNFGINLSKKLSRLERGQSMSTCHRPNPPIFWVGLCQSLTRCLKVVTMILSLYQAAIIFFSFDAIYPLKLCIPFASPWYVINVHTYFAHFLLLRYYITLLSYILLEKAELLWFHRCSRSKVISCDFSSFFVLCRSDFLKL